MLSLEDKDEEFIEEYKRVITNKDISDAEDITSTELGVPDPYLDMELGIQRGEDLQHANVKRRGVGEDGTPLGVANNNPLLDSLKYEVEFIDGQIEFLTANLIA